MMQMSQIGKNDSGYTLIEVIGVVAILGLVMGISITSFNRDSPQTILKQTAQSTMRALQQARVQATIKNKPQIYQVDNTLSIVTTFFPTFANKDQSWDRTLRFYPDGTATGGTLRHAIGNQTIELSINWITGHVEVTD